MYGSVGILSLIVNEEYCTKLFENRIDNQRSAMYFVYLCDNGGIISIINI